MVESNKNAKNEERGERASSVKPFRPPSSMAGAAADSSYKKRYDNHFGHVKTGNVNEKRNFWLRSTSMEKLQNGDANLGPRRSRRLGGGAGESWIKQSSEATRPE